MDGRAFKVSDFDTRNFAQPLLSSLMSLSNQCSVGLNRALVSFPPICLGTQRSWFGVDQNTRPFRGSGLGLLDEFWSGLLVSNLTQGALYQVCFACRDVDEQNKTVATS